MVRDNPARQRFELQIGDQLAIAEYRREKGQIVFLHTEVPKALQGKGFGGELARGALELVRESGDKVVARCSFIATFIQQNAEFHGLRAAP